MALAVRHAGDHVPARAAALEQRGGQRQVGQLDVAVDVIRLPGAAALQHQLDTAAVVIHVDPAADVAAVAVQRDRPPVEQVGREQRDDLLRVLVRAVVVAAAGDPHVQPVGAGVGPGHQVAAGLGRRVWRVRLQRRLLRP